MEPEPSIKSNRPLTPEEAAEYLQLHIGSVRRLLRSGGLPGVKVGGSWRITREVLDAYLRGEKPKPAEE